jgi:hypothetical protein
MASSDDVPDQNAIVGDDARHPIPFASRFLHFNSGKFRQLFESGLGRRDLVFDSRFQRDSVVQFLNACQHRDVELTRANVLEVDLLCTEWKVDRSIHDRVRRFIERAPGGGSLLVAQLLLRLQSDRPTVDVEAALRRDISVLVHDPQRHSVPVPVLSRIIDFGTYASEVFQSVFTFCKEYLEEHGSSASLIFKTLVVDGLSKDNLMSLCSLRDLHWCFMNESLSRTIADLVESRTSLEAQTQSLLTLLRSERDENQQLLLAFQALQGEVQTLKSLQAEVQALKALQGEVQTLKSELTDQKAWIGFPSNGRMFRPGPDPLNGVISYLTAKHGGNVHDRNIVRVTSSSLATGRPGNTLQATVDLRSTQRFCSDYKAEKPHEWLCYDFQQLRIEPTHYFIRTWSGPAGHNHLKSWALEGSMDGSVWEELDSRQNNDLLNGSRRVGLFSVLRFREVRMVRIRLTGLSHHDHWVLELEALELFGILEE